jgi:hypothetical protein
MQQLKRSSDSDSFSSDHVIKCFFELRVRLTPAVNMSVDDNSNNDELDIDLPAITSICECEKIDKLGEKGLGDESWQCH